ncbi:MAG: 50S ribosomal protein L17 [bacterium]|nr:50S ribosomal protein L17 [bacterium]
MRHLSTGRKFGRKRGQRRAFLHGLAANLITRKRVRTTEARAKEIRHVVERYITHGKKQNVAGLRLLMKTLPKSVAYTVYHDLAPKYKDRKGGYTKITKLGKPRQHDASRMAVIEFV